MKNQTLHPVIKWAGGKSQLIDKIRRKYPAELGKQIKKYAEPFIGGGAVLFDILSRYELDEIYISDINSELVNMYRKIKTDSENLIDMLEKIQAEYLQLDDDNRKKFFLSQGNRYNALIRAGISKDSIESAAIFIFLNRTCFNGLYRVNRQGMYNVPAGKYKNPRICDAENLRAVSESLQNVEIVCADYRSSVDFIDEKTFVYFDPPYRPLNATSNFTAYSENIFDDRSQTELAEFVQMLDKQGAKILVSNSDPKNADPNDNFFDDLYSKQTISRISASRMINRNADGRGKIAELLISNF